MSQSRRRSNEAIKRDRELRTREIAWEIAMTERIKTESALIRAENEQKKLLLDRGHRTARKSDSHLWKGAMPPGMES